MRSVGVRTAHHPFPPSSQFRDDPYYRGVPGWSEEGRKRIAFNLYPKLVLYMPPIQCRVDGTVHERERIVFIVDSQRFEIDVIVGGNSFNRGDVPNDHISHIEQIDRISKRIFQH